MAQYDSKTSKNVPKWSKMSQNALKWTKNGQKRLEMTKNGPKKHKKCILFFYWIELAQNNFELNISEKKVLNNFLIEYIWETKFWFSQNGPIWLKNIQKRTKMIQNAPKCPEMKQKRPKTPQNDQKWPKKVQKCILFFYWIELAQNNV